MKFELSNPIVFKTMIEALNMVTDEAKIECGVDNIRVNALSKDHTTFMTADLDKYLFDTYECNGPFTMIVDVNQLSKILKRCKNTDILHCNVDEGNLKLTFQGDSTRSFNSRLIDNDYESPRPPMIEYPCNISIPTSVFNDSLGDLKIFSDVIHIAADNDYLLFKGDGQNGDGLIRYLHGEHIQDYYKSQYSIEKLTDLMKAKGFSETVTIGLGNDLPLRLEFKLVTGDGRIEFLVAPRISE